MKKHLTMRINIIIAIIIILGFLATTFINYNTYSKVINDDIENISKLTSTNIYSEINNKLIKPIFVSLTMANDSFLIEWLLAEKENKDDGEYIEKLQTYLVGIKNKYNYNSVFVVSDTTKNYYHYKGIHKVIDEKTEHDQWYYSFIDENVLYELDIDNDEAKNEKLTVFVNCRIDGPNGSLMGVAGVGQEMEEIQDILNGFEEKFDLEAFLVDKNGLVQAHSDTSHIERLNIFDETETSKFKETILNNKDSLETLRYKAMGVDGYLITRYIEELDWYLIVKKDTSVLADSFRSQIIKDLLIIMLVLITLIVLSTKLLRKYKEEMILIAKTDQLTKLPNRRAFDESLNKAIGDFDRDKNIFNIFIFDIDGFKKVNDDFGHLLGDQVIYQIGNIAKNRLGEAGMVYRWGGDEFVGIIQGPLNEAEIILGELVQEIYSYEELKNYGISISVGLTSVKEKDTTDSLMNRADKGLYEAKTGGKNRIHISL